jgi:hypothetical protein
VLVEGEDLVVMEALMVLQVFEQRTDVDLVVVLEQYCLKNLMAFLQVEEEEVVEFQLGELVFLKVEQTSLESMMLL